MTLRCLLAILMSIIFWQASATEPSRNLSAISTGEKRVALVIGNSKYPAHPLKNPVNDARDMATALRKIGFDVIEKTDIAQKEMNRAIAQFGSRLTADTVALFFYAGHGIQVRGKNYLIPIDAQIESENSVRAETVDVDTLLDQLSASPLNVVILDACRNNPFERRFRSVGGGLAQMDAPKGTLIAYATSPGKVASDGEGRNGLYTQELLKVIQAPGLPVEQVFKKVRANVARVTRDNQIPWEASSLTGDFFFSSSQSPTASLSQQPTLIGELDKDNALKRELAFWESIKDSGNPDEFRTYLATYPRGQFQQLALVRLNYLKKQPTEGVSSVETPLVPNKKATIHIVRISAFGGVLLTPTLFLNELPLGKLPNGTHLSTAVASGKYKLILKTWGDHVFSERDIDLTSGGTFYVKVDLGANPQRMISLSSEADGKAALAETVERTTEVDSAITPSQTSQPQAPANTIQSSSLPH